MDDTQHFLNGRVNEIAVPPKSGKPKSGKAVNLVAASEIELESSPPYLVKGLCHKGDLSVWYGPSGSGKTFLVLWLAYCVATGAETFFGRRVRQGRVALFSLEGASGFSKRVTALQQKHGPAHELFVHREPLVLFENDSVLNEMVAEVNSIGADLVIVDTLSRTMPGANENSPEDMTKMLRAFAVLQAATGAHVLLVHHTGKTESLGARGHSSLKAAADVECEVTPGEAGDRSFRISKGRDEADGQVYGFRLNVLELGHDEDGDPISTCLVDGSDTPARNKPAKLSKNDQVALDWLRQAIAEHGEEAPYGVPSGTRATTRENWMAIALKRTGEPKSETLRKAIYRATSNLTAAKVIAVNNPWFWVLK